MELGELPKIGLALVLAGVFFVIGFLVLADLRTDIECPSGYTPNASSSTGCQVATNTSLVIARTNAGNATINLQGGLSNVTDYASTWGTIIGVAVLLGIVLVGFAFGRKRGMF